MRLPRPHRHDALIALTGLVGGLVFWALGLHMAPVDERPLKGAWVLLPLAVMAGAELFRRTWPQTALVTGTVAIVADQFTQSNLVTIVMFTDVIYAAVLYGTPAAARRIPVSCGLITVAVTIGFLAWFRTPEALVIGVVTGLVSLAPALTGVVVRDHRDAAEAARLRAEQTKLLAEVDRTQAVVAERARMARELHDMVANHLSAIAIHSTAALSIGDPGTSHEALSVIRENSVEGLAEMRRLIGLLRDSGGTDPAAASPAAAAPSLAAVDALIEQAEAHGAPAGLRFALHDARDGQGPLPAPVELAAYRIVQESLTNALKHASPGEVTVTLTQNAWGLTVLVNSPYERGDGANGPRAPGSGAGLVGMRERATLLAGRFDSGPTAAADGGKIWRVRAELPMDEGKSVL
ncbi:histidine kinase [Streptomyces sp. HNM0663]|uniref:histidine kinase n=1 Tax=Streptomyces chengmaiensis TaxID=3040919 RepID=A0ABT6HF99_9ACTN|nr:histidine kinase [Streptomyces chengmaiensis]MDH2387338.1 histidine kinase [Streptomyces chengmaiensis]